MSEREHTRMFQTLNARILEVEERIRRLQLGVSGAVVIQPPGLNTTRLTLAFMKRGDAWGLWLEVAGKTLEEFPTYVHLPTTSLEWRMLATKHMAELITTLERNAAELQVGVTEAIATLDGVIADFDRPVAGDA